MIINVIITIPFEFHFIVCLYREWILKEGMMGSRSVHLTLQSNLTLITLIMRVWEESYRIFYHQAKLPLNRHWKTYLSPSVELGKVR